MSIFCTMIFIGIICYVVYEIWSDANQAIKEHQAGVKLLMNQFNGQKSSFDGALAGFFDTEYSSYHDTYKNLKKYISNMESINRKLKSKSNNDNYSDIINICSKLADEFNAFGQRVKGLPFTYMVDSANYGKIHKSFWNSVRSMDKKTADTIIDNCERYLSGHDYSQIFMIDIEVILRCIWFYATDKPYSVLSFKKAVNVFNRFVEDEHVDVIIADMYAIKQMGGEDVLRNRIHNILETTDIAKELTLIASALMWIKAYQEENMILQHMLSVGIQMSAKMQERLQFLTIDDGKAPNSFDVVSNRSVMYFDVSALAWKDDEYTRLFETLVFQEKTLSYSLAVRDEDKNLFITNGINLPDISVIFSKLNSFFADEYDNAVTATIKKCIAVSGSGEENMEGILVESNECKQMGILVHVARIGKKLNIKFYTLFMPSGARLADQKKQAISLYKKLSPSVAMWESSLKESALMAIQQLLNAEPQATFGGGIVSINDEGPIF